MRGVFAVLGEHRLEVEADLRDRLGRGVVADGQRAPLHRTDRV